MATKMAEEPKLLLIILVVLTAIVAGSISSPLTKEMQSLLWNETLEIPHIVIIRFPYKSFVPILDVQLSVAPILHCLITRNKVTKGR